jgi:hypothetical protein
MAASDAAAPSSCLQLLLEAVRRRSAELAGDLHPAWLEQGLQRLGLPAAAAASGSTRCAAALAAVYRLQWPPLDRFRCAAHRVVLLPRADMLRVLAAVALHAERERMRLTIGAGVRAMLVERLGEVAYRALLEAPSLRGGQLAPLTAAELAPDRLAWAGVGRLVTSGAWNSRSLLQRVRLALEPTQAGPVPGAAGRRSQPDVVARLPTYFPEHAWLFGSPMDLALSASTTA